MDAPSTAQRDAHYSAINHEDAKGMWCPEVRRLYGDEDGNAGINRRTNSSGEEVEPARVAKCIGAKCIGAKCMAWRWVAATEETEVGEFLFSSTSLGYCGKAGGL